VLFLKAWVLFPALLCVLSLGWGLLLERLSGGRLRGVFLLPVGLAAILVVARAAMSTDASAELGTPLVVAGAVTGLVLGLRQLGEFGVDRWAAAAAVAVFAVFAAPIVLSGSATFAGYTVLGDTAVHFILADWIAAHGTELGSLEPSSYRQTLETYFGSGYPLGTHAAMAAVRPLAFVDVAWAFQPFLCFLAACLALTLYGLASAVVRPGWRSAGLAFLASQPALVYAFAMQGSVKELATLWLVPLVAALVASLPATQSTAEDTVGFREAARAVLPLAVVAAAAVSAIGLAAGVWLAPMLLAAAWIVFRRPDTSPRTFVAVAAVFATFMCLVSIPTLLDSSEYVDVAAEVVTSETELGNLARPLKLPQVLGIWLTGDYRMSPAASGAVDARDVTSVLLVIAALSGVLGVVWLLRRRAVGPLLFLVVSLLALAYVTRAGSPWADAKALAIVSPAVLLTAGFGAIALESRRLRAPALAVGLLLGVGVLGSNAAIYHDVSLAPADRLTELGDMGERAAGSGPVLYTEFEEFGKYYLRDADPVGATEAFVVPALSPTVNDGGRPPFGEEANLSTLRVPDLRRFGSIVLRRSPQGPRPPAGFRLASSDRFYELWVKAERGPTSVAQEPLNGNGGREDCRTLRDLASMVPSGDGSLTAATAPPTVELVSADQRLPAAWRRWKGIPDVVRTIGPGSVSDSVEVSRGGSYEVWLQGSFGRRVEVLIDGRSVASVEDQLTHPAGWVELGAVALKAGRHEVALSRGEASLAPGSGDGPRTVGSLVLRRGPSETRQVVVPATGWHRLCGIRLLSASASVPAS
jgi:hypothetical protein